MVEWFAEFEGQLKPLDDIWAPEMAAIIGGTREHISNLPAGASSPEDLTGVRAVIYAEEGERASSSRAYLWL